MKKKTPIEKFLALSDAGKAAEVAPFERQNIGPGRPLTAVQRKRWSRIQQKVGRGRPKLGEGSTLVPLSIERGLLKEADAWAKRHKLKRSQMVAQGLRLVMGQTAVAVARVSAATVDRPTPCR